MDTVGRLGLDADTPQEQQAFAQQLIAWAAERHPADALDVTPAALLAEAGQILDIVGDHAVALEVYRRASTAEGTVEPDVRCFLHRALVSVGDMAAARLLAEEIRRSAPPDPGTYAMIGETYEKTGDLRAAHRWLNLGVRRIAEQTALGGSTDAGLDLLLLAIVRRRVRLALELFPDAVDRLADGALSAPEKTTGERRS